MEAEVDYGECLRLSELIGLQCSLCMNIAFPPVSTCPACKNEELETIHLERDGKLISYTVIEDPIAELKSLMFRAL